jgi:carbonic anhydrase
VKPSYQYQIGEVDMKRGISVLCALVVLATVSVARAGTDEQVAVPATKALSQLKNGAERFAAGQAIFPHQDGARIREIVAGQHPFATVLSCSDSRVPVEMIFDAGFGDLLTVRVAGNVVAAEEVGTIEYGIEYLGSKLIVVLGHTECDAVKEALSNAKVEGATEVLIDEIRPAVTRVREKSPTLKGSEFVSAAITENVWYGIENLINHSALIRERMQNGTLRIVGAVYHLEDNRVEWLGSHPQEKELLAVASAPIRLTAREPAAAAAAKADAPQGGVEQESVLRPGQTEAKTTITQEQWLSLAAEMAALKTATEQLENLVGVKSTQLASLSDEVSLSGTEESLSERLTSLAVRVDTLLKSQPQTPTADQHSPADNKISGFVDGSSYLNHNTRAATFGLDQVEVDLRRSLSKQTQVRADIEGLNDGKGGVNLGVEQAFMSWRVGSQWKVQFSFGKFNAPIGFEALDPVDMYQYSRGLVGTYCSPSNLTGVMSTVSAPRLAEWSVYLVNGWDVNSDNNKGKTVGTRFSLSPLSNLTLGLSAISGAELSDNTSSHRSVVDCDLTYHLLNWWLIGGEANVGWETGVDGSATAKWQGFLLMNNMKFLGRYGLTVRGDYLHDANGDRTGTPQELKAICLSPSVTIADGLSALFEIRHDWSNRPVLAPVDGGSKRNQTATAFEFTYAF